jgi:hypothetical protein
VCRANAGSATKISTSRFSMNNRLGNLSVTLSRSCMVEAKRHVSRHRAGLLSDDKTRFGVTDKFVDSNRG